jgi:hypothetical protein
MKIKKEEYPSIIERRRNGEKAVSIAADYDVTPHTIYKIEKKEQEKKLEREDPEIEKIKLQLEKTILRNKLRKLCENYNWIIKTPVPPEDPEDPEETNVGVLKLPEGLPEGPENDEPEGPEEPEDPGPKFHEKTKKLLERFKTRGIYTPSKVKALKKWVDNNKHNFNFQNGVHPKYSIKHLANEDYRENSEFLIKKYSPTYTSLIKLVFTRASKFSEQS